MSRPSSPSDYNTRINIPSQEEYEWLNSVRKGLGLTWRGMMLKAEQRLLAAERTWPPALRTQHVVSAPDQSDADIEAERDVEADTEAEAESDSDSEIDEVAK
ncbi:hypothetical protein Nmn1133_12855 [Halosegnis longus]|uniref:Uncharacterized protein n=2 Tax=Halobacteriales TaxID=2235 RepID=A0AAJ4UUS0_9EURY|nr:hypothetical protein Nmn1133_12855 [Salella cibi]